MHIRVRKANKLFDAKHEATAKERRVSGIGIYGEGKHGETTYQLQGVAGHVKYYENACFRPCHLDCVVWLAFMR